MLAAEGWHADTGLRSASLLLSLLPSTTIDRLPVFPRFDHGRIQDMTFVRQLNEKERLVVRLWSAHTNIVMAEGPVLPLSFGTAIIETAEHAAYIGSLPRTKDDFVTPLRSLSQDAREANVSTVEETRGGLVVLRW